MIRKTSLILNGLSLTLHGNHSCDMYLLLWESDTLLIAICWLLIHREGIAELGWEQVSCVTVVLESGTKPHPCTKMLLLAEEN